MDNKLIEIYEFWINNVSEKDLKNELINMQNDEKEIENSFYKTLEFGTAGLRGVMGAGTNKMNKYIIMQTTLAIAKYLNKTKGKNASLVITYDTRNNSEEFAHITASVLATNGVKCFITNGPKPTPYESFLVRALKTDMGVNITSSHNPKIYNGYKVYENQGCQIGEDVAEEISKIRESINPFEIDVKPFENLLSSGLIEYVSDDLEERYLDAVYNEHLLSGDIKTNLKVVYTPLNGVGEPFVTRILKRIGYENLIYVKEQNVFDGNFTTCPYPNPERDDALELALKYAKDNDADLVISTDPDSDRLSVIVKGDNGYVHLSGDEIGVLLSAFVLEKRKQNGTLPKNPCIIRSIVTTTMVDEIVASYGGRVYEALTGFKNLCGKMRKEELNGNLGDIVFTFEDACGYLKGSYVRDKDGVLASMLFMELASECERAGKTVLMRLNELKSKYGPFDTALVSKRYEGADGEKTKNAIIKNIRENKLSEVAGKKVVKVIDFLNQDEIDVQKSNVLKFILEGGDQFIIRPSGTEPLLKCYITVKNGDKAVMQAIKDTINSIF